jgi:hypothetical protein
MNMTLLKLNLSPAMATIAALKRRYKLQSGDLDETFGVRRVDDAGIYAVRVTEEAARIITGATRSARRQSNPKVAPLGLRRTRGPTHKSA